MVGDGGYGERRRRWRSAVRERERGSSTGESEREQGGGVASSRDTEARRGGQAGRERGGVALRPCARAGHTPGRLAPGGRRRWWAGLACWASQLAGPHREEPR